MNIKETLQRCIQAPKLAYADLLYTLSNNLGISSGIVPREYLVKDTLNCLKEGDLNIVGMKLNQLVGTNSYFDDYYILECDGSYATITPDAVKDIADMLLEECEND